MLEEIIKEKQSNATIKIFDGVDVSDEKAVTGMFNALKSEKCQPGCRCKQCWSFGSCKHVLLMHHLISSEVL